VSLRTVPVTYAQACDFIDTWRRHHRPPQGHKYSIGVAQDDVHVGVAVVGRPVARMLDDGLTLEVTRVATDGTRNAVRLTALPTPATHPFRGPATTTVAGPSHLSKDDPMDTASASPATAPPVWTVERIRALGAVTDIATVGQIFGMSRSSAYELARSDRLPVPVLRVGSRYRVSVAAILAALGAPNDSSDAAAHTT
jgi:hypothetical protein